MVCLKASVYALVALLSPLTSLLVTAADANTQTWPNSLQLVASTMTGVIAALVAVRAFFDGSSNRWEANKNGSFKAKPEPITEPTKAPNV